MTTTYLNSRKYEVRNGQAYELGHVPGWGATSTLVSDAMVATAVLAKVAAEVAERDALRADAATGRRTFVRFGALPTSGRSYNQMDNRAEAGVSVYAAWITDDVVYLDCTDTYATVGYANTHTLHEVEGVELDERGGDDEPLLADARIVGVLTQSVVVVK